MPRMPPLTDPLADPPETAIVSPEPAASSSTPLVATFADDAGCEVKRRRRPNSKPRADKGGQHRKPAKPVPTGEPMTGEATPVPVPLAPKEPTERAHDAPSLQPVSLPDPVQPSAPAPAAPTAGISRLPLLRRRG